MARSTYSAGTPNPLSACARNPPSDSVASLLLSTLLDSVGERLCLEKARATSNVEPAIGVEIEAQAEAHAQGQVLDTGRAQHGWSLGVPPATAITFFGSWWAPVCICVLFDLV